MGYSRHLNLLDPPHPRSCTSSHDLDFGPSADNATALLDAASRNFGTWRLPNGDFHRVVEADAGQRRAGRQYRAHSPARRLDDVDHGERDKVGVPLPFGNAPPRLFDGAVSYTHLRAHETVLDLVCRLLLEK